MFQATARDIYRCAGFGCLLCVVSCVPGAAQAIESILAHGYRESFAHGTAEQHQEGFTSRYDWEAPPASSADWRGIKKDTWYFLGYQFAVIGVLYVAPEDISGWSDEQKDNYSFAKWRRNVTNPRWDQDRWWINYILHPYWGGAYYIRARERGFDRGQSFLYSTLLSTLFEFGAEALFEPPSYQDLIVTPVAGYLVGQYLFEPLREHIRAQPGEPGWTGKAVLFLTDPLGVINVQIDRMLGVNANISLQLGPVASHERWPASGQSLYRQYDDRPDPGAFRGWGLQLRATW